MSEEKKTVLAEEPAKSKGKGELYIYAWNELAGGFYKSYFSVYVTMLFTNVYMFSATLTAILQTISSLSSYIVAPLSAYIIDHFNFKTGKYWPYILFCLPGIGVLYLIMFTIPILTPNASKLAAVVLTINIIVLIFNNLGANANRQIYARVCKTPKDRSNVSMWAKIARDGTKTALGLVYAPLLVYLMAVYKSEPKAWAVVAAIFAIPPIALYIFNGIWVKNSQIEKDNIIQAAATKAAPKQQKGNILDTFKGIFANRHMLCAFISFGLTKLYYFSFLTGGSYTFRYYFGNFSLFAVFSTGCTLLAIIGAFATPFLRKIFKDVKYTFAGSIAIQAVLMIAALFIYNASRPWPSMIIIFATFFFNGVSDTMSMPLFVGASDYANAKYKTNDVGLTMAIWGLAMNVGTLANTWIRTWVLNSGGFDAKALAKPGAVVPLALKQNLWTYNTIIPLVCMVVATLLIFFGYGLKDDDIEKYRKENAERLGTK